MSDMYEISLRWPIQFGSNVQLCSIVFSQTFAICIAAVFICSECEIFRALCISFALICQVVNIEI